MIDTDYALSDMAICWHRFDKESNDYDKSEIKQFINSELTGDLIRSLPADISTRLLLTLIS